MINRKILLVEDNVLFSDNLKKSLSQYELVCSDTKSMCIEMLKKESIDLILLDINLPDCNDLSLLEHITHHYPDLPVIVLTVEEKPDFAAEFIKKGAKDYLRKALYFEDPSILNRRMDSLLQNVSIKKTIDSKNSGAIPITITSLSKSVISPFSIFCAY